MQRYFVSKDAVTSGQQVVISGSDHHHILRVMRMKPGDLVKVVVGDAPYLAKIAVLTDAVAWLDLQEPLQEQAEPELALTLLQGLPKGEKIELVIRQAAEIGVADIIVFAAHRSVAVLKADKIEARLARWRKIAKEAAELAQRDRIPNVTYASSLKEAAQQLPAQTRLLVPYELQSAELPTLKNVLKEWGRPLDVAFTIGPEGGFAEEEVAMLEAAGGTLLTLGKRILRTETAGLVVAAILLYEWEQLGVK